MSRSSTTVALVAATLTCVASALLPAVPASATTSTSRVWYVSAAGGPGGNGSGGAPFRTLAQVQKASKAGDEIVVVPAPKSAPPLNGGIQLKPGQRLVGGGPAVAGHTATLAKLPALENTAATNLSGDAVRLANNATVQNIVVKTSNRGAIYGLNTTGVTITGNDISNQNTSCALGFDVQPFNVPTGSPGVTGPPTPAVAPQNGWAAIMLDATHARGRFTINTNNVHDATCGDGVDVRAMGTSNLTGQINANKVTRLAQGIQFDPTEPSTAIGSVLAIGVQALDTAKLTVTQDYNSQTSIGSPNADCEGQMANTAGAGVLHDTIDHNFFQKAIGGTSCNGFETIISSGTGTLNARLLNSTFLNNVGDVFEENNLGAASTMSATLSNVYINATTTRGLNPPGSSDGGVNPAPFNLGDCALILSTGGGNSTTYTMTNSTLTNCNNGLSAFNNAGRENGTGATKNMNITVSHSVITNNDKYGIHLLNDTPLNVLHANISTTRVTGNGQPGISFENLPNAAVTDPQLDLGGGTLESPGKNCLYGNATADAQATTYAVRARHNWWGHPGAPTSAQLSNRLSGSVATDNGLTAKPACGLTSPAP